MRESVAQIARTLAADPAPATPLVVLPSDPRAQHKRPWWRQGGLENSTPFATTGLGWCVHCQDETDADTEAHHSGTVYVYRQRCLRCGKVRHFGVYSHVPLLSQQPLPAVALTWCFAEGADRR